MVAHQTLILNVAVRIRPRPQIKLNKQVYETTDQRTGYRFFDSKCYETWTPEQIVDFQLFQDRLCMPFDVFHAAIEKVLGRPVFTHEFAFRDRLIKECRGDRPAPMLDEIISLIPEEKQVAIFVE